MKYHFVLFFVLVAIVGCDNNDSPTAPSPFDLVTGTPPGTCAIGAPEIKSLTPGDGTVEIIWDVVSGRVYRTRILDKDGVPLVSWIISMSGKHTFSDLTNGATYVVSLSQKLRNCDDNNFSLSTSVRVILPTVDPKDLSEVSWLDTDVSLWNETSAITNVRIGRGASAGICIDHTEADEWPVVEEWGGLQVTGNPWIFVNVDGKWYAAAYEWTVRDETCNFNGEQDGSPEQEISQQLNRSPLDNWVPQSGERIGFMVSTPARHGPKGPRQERSDVRFMNWP